MNNIKERKKGKKKSQQEKELLWVARGFNKNTRCQEEGEAQENESYIDYEDEDVCSTLKQCIRCSVNVYSSQVLILVKFDSVGQFFLSNLENMFLFL